MTETEHTRDTYDLSHFIMSAGAIGRLKTIDTINVLPGDKVDLDLVGNIRLSPLRRGLAIDSKVDICSFYIPHRHIYGDKWIQLIKDGFKPTGGVTLPDEEIAANSHALDYLGTHCSMSEASRAPLWLTKGYRQIYNNYFKYPSDKDVEGPFGGIFNNDAIIRNGLRCCHLPTIWTSPLPPDAQTKHDMATESNKIDIIALRAEYAKLESEQEREYFMRRYRDIIDSMGGNTSYDADNRPLFIGHTEFWASGYEVNGTDQTSLGQFSGRVSQSFRHNVPDFVVPEHGTIWTVILVRFPPISCYERDYLEGITTPSYFDIACDPNIVANFPVQEIDMSSIFAGISTQVPRGKIKIPTAQYYRYKRSHVDSRYRDLGGFPFIDGEPYSVTSDPYANCYVDDTAYESMFQTTQLYQWSLQSKNNVMVSRNIPTARTSILTNA